jgi:hypothetical protein
MRPIVPVILAAVMLAVSHTGLLSADADVPESEPTAWSRTLDTAGGWWQRSRDFADRAMTDARGLFADDRDFARVWESVVPKLDSALVLEERQEASSRKGLDRNRPALQSRGDQRTARRGRADPVDVAGPRLPRAHPVLQGRDRRARAEIADARQKRITAPAESTIKKTVGDYDRSSRPASATSIA